MKPGREVVYPETTKAGKKNTSNKTTLVDTQRIFHPEPLFSSTISFSPPSLNTTKHTFPPLPTWRILVAEIAGLLPGFQMFSDVF